jgi:dTDP-N-acetylfucosamine:lipid II N-acetylfucosaminyltransferase
MNLHITHDDKFLDYFIDIAEKVSTDNKYIIYTWNGILKHTKSKNITQVNATKSEIEDLAGDLRQYNAVFLHYYSELLMEIVKDAPNGVKFVWLFFGGDGFRHTAFDKQYYQPMTKNLLSTIERKKLKNILHWHPKQLWWNIQVYRNKAKFSAYVDKLLESTTPKISYFAHYIPRDFALLSPIFSKSSMKYIDFNYGTVEDIIAGTQTDFPKGDHIMIGNSEANTANHLDVMYKLYELGIKNKKIFMPLSYGYIDDVEYKEQIIKEGYKLFGNNFVPITEFMKKEDYHEKVMFQCGYVMMNHDRSQAGANNLVALYSGQKLFMSEKSTLYHLYKEIGCIVYTVQNCTLQDLQIPLTQEQIAQNRKAVLSFWGRESVIERYRKMFEIINN